MAAVEGSGEGRTERAYKYPQSKKEAGLWVTRPDLAAKAGRRGATAQAARMTAEERSARASHASKRRHYAKGVASAELRCHVTVDVAHSDVLAAAIRRSAEDVLLGKWDLGLELVPNKENKPCRAGVYTQLMQYARQVEKRAVTRIVKEQKLIAEKVAAEQGKESGGAGGNEGRAIPEAETALDALGKKWAGVDKGKVKANDSSGSEG